MFLKQNFPTKGSTIWKRISEVWKNILEYVIILPHNDGFAYPHVMLSSLW